MDRRQLQLHLHAKLGRVREPEVRRPRRIARKAGERLEPDQVAARELGDRLERHSEQALVEHLPDAVGPLAAPGGLTFLAPKVVGELGHHFAQDPGRQAGLAHRGAADRRQELARWRPLDQISHGTGAEHLDHRLAVVVR